MARWLRTTGAPPPASRIHGDTRPPGALLQPTAEEARNGWDAEALTAYHRDRERAQSASILDRAPPKPTRANSKFNPLRWRG